MKFKNIIKLIWLKILQKGTISSSNLYRFEKLYHVNDPWEMSSKKEQNRFSETNRIIQEELMWVGSLLEIGCGEGHQSEYLTNICNKLYGFDVSKKAVERARIRCPECTLTVADIDTYKPEQEKFDLVVAFEILYYVKDIPAALERMNELGNKCMISFYQSGSCILDDYFSDNKNIKSRVIQVDDTSWKVVWWDNQNIKNKVGS